MRFRAAALWGAFALAHILVGVLGWMLPAQPMADVVLVYQPWSAAALTGGTIVGITEPWVYPQLALVPMTLAQLPALALTLVLDPQSAYLIAWAVLVTVCDLLGFAVLVGGRPGARRRAAGWFWTAALVLLGPIALYRIDAVTVPLAVAAGVWLARRPRIAAALLTAGVWIKIWPGALLLAAVIAMRSRIRTLAVAVAATAGLIVVLVLLGAGSELFGFLTEQTGRGLQIEAVAATPFLWLAAAGGASVAYSYDILTYQVHAPGTPVVTAALTPLMILVMLAISVAGALRARRGASWRQLVPPLSLALVTGLIVTNKVGSPQFQTWLIAPIVLWLLWDRGRAGGAAALVLMLCALTFAVYPLSYGGLLQVQPLPIVLLSIRNLLLVVLLAHAVRAVLRTPVSRS